MLIHKDSRIGDVVVQNFRTSKVFESLGLDFCCGGKKSIAEACREKGIDPEFVVSEVSKVESGSSAAAHFEKWEADFLADYIVNNHHSYVNSSISTIEHHLAKVIDAHGVKRPELSKIDENFFLLKEELLNHMAKEEKMLFPYIKKLNIAYKNTLEMSAAPFGSVLNPIKVMEDEHTKAGRLMGEISKLTNSYLPPEDACGTFKVLYAELREFEQDLHMHIHLENNILFPKAAELEKKMNKIYSTL